MLQPHQLRSLQANGLGSPLPAPIIRKKRKNEEWEIQSGFFSQARPFLQSKGIPWQLLFAVPNGSMLKSGGMSWEKAVGAIRANMLRMAGQTNGVVDVILLWRTVQWPSLLIEFKTPKGVLSPDQIVFRDAAIRAGFCHNVCRSVDEGMNALKDYLP